MSPPGNTLSSKHREPSASCGCAVRARRRKAVAVDPQIKAANVKRLRRIAGQIRGLERMVSEERYCADILIQISSVQEALRAVGKALMGNHLRHCAAQAIRSGPGSKADAVYDELLQLLYKYSRCGFARRTIGMSAQPPD